MNLTKSAIALLFSATSLSMAAAQCTGIELDDALEIGKYAALDVTASSAYCSSRTLGLEPGVMSAECVSQAINECVSLLMDYSWYSGQGCSSMVETETDNCQTYVCSIAPPGAEGCDSYTSNVEEFTKKSPGSSAIVQALVDGVYAQLEARKRTAVVGLRGAHPDVDDALKAGEQAVKKYWRDEGSDCANKYALKYRGDDIKKNNFPLGNDDYHTNAYNTRARIGVDKEVKKIWDSCVSPRVDDALEAGEQAVQKYWRDEGSDCANKYALRYRVNKIKDSSFPLGNDKYQTNAYNTRARIGVDKEAKKIWDDCNHYTKADTKE